MIGPTRFPCATTLALALLGLPQAVSAASAPPCMTCVTIGLTPAQAEALLASNESLAGVELLIALDAPSALGARLPELMFALRQRGARHGLEMAGDVHTLSRGLELAELTTTFLVRLVESPERAASINELVFDLKRLLTELRARNGAASIGLEAPLSSEDDLVGSGLGAYVDFMVRPGLLTMATDASGGERRVGLPASNSWRRVEAGRAGSLENLLDASRAGAGGRVLLSGFTDDEPLRAAVRAVRQLGDLFPPALTPLPNVQIACEPIGEATHTADGCHAEVFLHPYTLAAIAVIRAPFPVRATIVTPAAERAERYAGDALIPAPVQTTASGARVSLPDIAGTFVLRIQGWGRAQGDRFASTVQVVGYRELAVDEIVARHQAVAAAQARDVTNVISTGSSVFTFEVRGFSAPVVISADTVVYAQGSASEIEQRSIRVNGLDIVNLGESAVPRLPIIEPERVSAPPLTITLSELYRYRLEGRDRIGDQDAYIVGFVPRRRGGSLFRGRAWIAQDSFALIRVEAAQGGLKGPIISSEQHDDFASVIQGGRQHWLLARSEVFQVYEGAGFRTPIHRVVELRHHEVNPPDFVARLANAHASHSVMLRDTPQGFRYLARSTRRSASGQPSRVESGASRRIRTIVFGLIVDPNITMPLPFAGLGYVDFDFLHSRAQVNAFFGGTFGQAAWSVPALAGTRWQLSGAAFLTMAKYNDRSFRGGNERFDENLRQRPARLVMGAMRPLAARTRLRADYEVDYTHLERSDSTSASFEVPASPLVHGARLTLETQRGPWTASAWWNPGRRQRWRAWGRPGGIDFDPAARDFQRTGVSLSRSFVFEPTLIGRIDAAWMAGRDLDRFSRFGFNAFENPLRGYPSASIRFDRGLVAHGGLSWHARPRARLDGFFDTALVRDPGLSRREKGFSGVGAALETPLPFDVLLSVEWGYGFQGRNRDGSAGTQVVKITGYKIF